MRYYIFFQLESEKMHLKQKLIELERTTHVERVQDDLKTKSPGNISSRQFVLIINISPSL